MAGCKDFLDKLPFIGVFIDIYGCCLICTYRDGRPYKIVLFPVDVSDKFTFGTHPTEWALHATPIQNRISITTLNPQFTAVKFKVNVYRKSAESCEHLSENKKLLSRPFLPTPSRL